MSQSIRLCGERDVPVGEARRFALGDHPPVALFNVEGTIYATADTCPHQRASLADGEVDGDEVICPLHFQVFHIPTGEAREGVTKTPVTTFPVMIENGDVLVELP